MITENIPFIIIVTSVKMFLFPFLYLLQINNNKYIHIHYKLYLSSGYFGLCGNLSSTVVLCYNNHQGNLIILFLA